MKRFYQLCFAACMVLFMDSGVNAQNTYFVKANAGGTNNGSSWANAFTSLQAALDAAVSGDQIWVAAGTYKPSKDITGSAGPADTRTKTFLLKNGVSVYGGFAGNESTLSSRVITANPTILSGDFAGDDGQNFSNNAENAYHVVVATNLTAGVVFDGFVVTGGNANNSAAFISSTVNHQVGGGFITDRTGTNVAIANSVFTSNSSTSRGGALFDYSSASTVTNCIIVDNKSGSGGGISNIFPTGNKYINCVIVNNQAGEGGGVYGFGKDATLDLLGCTIAGNSATTSGGGVGNLNAKITIKNSIIWGNTGGGSQGINPGSGIVTVSYSDVQGGYSGTGNVNAEPAFDKVSDMDGADNTWRTADDGLVLRETSAAANTGSNAGIPSGITTDITGSNRIQNTTVNMGAYETLKPSVRLYVKHSATGGNNGSSWVHAFTHLQDALDAAVKGDEIWVAGGVYKPSKDIHGNASPADARTKTFLLKSGVKVYGGFSGTESTPGDRALLTGEVTMLSGDLAGNDNFDDASSITDNAYHVVVANTLTTPTLFDGFIVLAGNANRSNTYLMNTASATISNAEGAGFVIVNSGTNLTIANSIFARNQSAARAGALLNHFSASSVMNSFFHNNKANAGGAICDVFPAGGQYINCVIADNQANEGGGVYTAGMDRAVNYINCTIARNTAVLNGGGFYNKYVNLAIANSIIWENTGAGTQGLLSETGTTVVSYSDVQGGYAGTGNISADPKFNRKTPALLSGLDWDFSLDGGLALLSNSPAIQAGSNAAIPAQITTDILGDPRIMNTTVNMGAFERLTAAATITLSNTTTTYTGEAKNVTATTDPAGLTVEVYYRNSQGAYLDDQGEPIVPVDAGVYSVEAFIADAIYGGSVSGTLTIEKVPAAIALSNLDHTYDGTTKLAQASTAPSGKTVMITYEKDGVAVAAPKAAGVYTVHAVIGETNYQGSATGTLTISKATASLTIGSLNHVYDGTAKTATAESSSPTGDIVFTYKQGNTVVDQPVNAGDYTVTATLNDVNYQGTATATLTIARATGTITLGRLTHVYDGTAKSPTITLTPTDAYGDLIVSYRREGTSVTSMVDAGTYTVIVSLFNPNYAVEVATETLTISKADQTITFNALPAKAMGDAPFNLNATASSGLPISFSGSDPVIASISGSMVTLAGPGTVTITASQAGNHNYNAASVVQTLTVTKTAQVITFNALPEKILGEEPFRLNASSSSGLSVRYTSDNTGVALIEGDLVKIVGAGEAKITTLQEGNEIYLAAAPVTQTLVVKLVTGTEASSNDLVKVYPNPAADYVLVEGYHASEGETFTLRDMSGKDAPTGPSRDGELLRLDMTRLAPGIYILTVNTRQGVITTRIVKK